MITCGRGNRRLLDFINGWRKSTIEHFLSIFPELAKSRRIPADHFLPLFHTLLVFKGDCKVLEMLHLLPREIPGADLRVSPPPTPP